MFEANWKDVVCGLKDSEMILSGRAVTYQYRYEFEGQAEVKEL